MWTFPSDKPLNLQQLTDNPNPNLPDGQQEGILGGGGGGGGVTEPSARPCLLHVQRLEVSVQRAGVSGPGLEDFVATELAAVLNLSTCMPRVRVELKKDNVFVHARALLDFHSREM